MYQRLFCKMIMVIMVLGAVIVSDASAQLTWSHYYNEAEMNQILAINNTSDGGFIMAIHSSTPGNNDFLVMKLDAGGDTQWQQFYGDGTNNRPSSVAQTSEGGYIVAGTTSYASGNDDIWIIKLTSTGSITWQKSYGTASTDRALHIEQTSDGGYIVSGFTGPSILVLKLNSSGNITWQKAISGSSSGRVIHQLSDGTYILAGETVAYGAGLSDVFVIKLDASGNISWQRSYGGAEDDYTCGIVQTIDGGYIVGATTESYGAGNADFWFVRLNSAGSITSQKTLGGTGIDFCHDFQATSDGGGIAAGFTALTNWDFQAVKVNSTGAIVWQKAYNRGMNEIAYAVKEINGAGLAFAGTSSNSTSGKWNAWLITTDSTGSMDATCNVTTTSYASVNTVVSANTTPATTSITEILPVNTAIAPVTASTSYTLVCGTTNAPALLSHKPAVDDSGGSTPNGIIEENEVVDLVGNLENVGSATAASVTGDLTTTDPVVINTSQATYPNINAGTSQNSTVNYNLTAFSGSRPDTHWDFVVTENPQCTGCLNFYFPFTYHVGNSFDDVLTGNIFYSFIEKLLHSGVTAGCTAINYCPDANVSRDQMAKFVCASMEKQAPGSCPTASCTNLFTDVPPSNIFCSHIEALYNTGVVSGCQTTPLMYCPADNTDRQAMAKFICVAMDKAVPGSCPLVPCAEVFGDVPTGNIFCSHIEALYTAGVVSGCQSSPLLYCPADLVTRAQMSKFLVNAFGFTL